VRTEWREYLGLRKAAAATETALKRSEQRIRFAMADNEVGTLDGRVVATWRNYEQTRLDGTALKETEPDTWARFAKTVAARRFLVKGE
jgi:predicted phage-related endonuclease